MGKPMHVITETRQEWAQRKSDEFLVTYLLGPLFFMAMFAVGIMLLTMSLALAIIGAIVGLVVYIMIYKWITSKNSKKKHGKNYKKDKSWHNRRTHPKGFVRDYLVWFLAFGIGIFLSNYLLTSFTISNVILRFLFYGFIIESCSKIMQIFVFHHKWTIDRHFFFWIIIQSLGFFLVSYLAGFIPLGAISLSKTGTLLVSYSILALIQMVFIRIIWKINLERKIFSF